MLECLEQTEAVLFCVLEAILQYIDNLHTIRLPISCFPSCTLAIIMDHSVSHILEVKLF